MTPNCNIIDNMPYDQQKEARKIIIECVLNSDISKHFKLLTELKTKLGNNFPTESLEDRILILSATLQTASSFKVLRDRNTFFKWMEKRFEEYYK
jgi:high affinity cGMP-specific 3',5'-cyclic phosphodiesterase 9